MSAPITRETFATEVERRAEVVRLLHGVPLSSRRHEDLVRLWAVVEQVGAVGDGDLGLELIDALMADGHELAELREETAADRD